MPVYTVLHLISQVRHLQGHLPPEGSNKQQVQVGSWNTAALLLETQRRAVKSREEMALSFPFLPPSALLIGKGSATSC